MERWKLYAFAAALFAGITAVIAKAGLKTIGADLGLAVRTAFVFIFTTAAVLLLSDTSKAAATLHAAGWKAIALLALSAFTTTLSWICYYRAMHEGYRFLRFPRRQGQHPRHPRPFRNGPRGTFYVAARGRGGSCHRRTPRSCRWKVTAPTQAAVPIESMASPDTVLFDLINRSWTSPFLDHFMPLISSLEVWKPFMFAGALWALILGGRPGRLFVLSKLDRASPRRCDPLSCAQTRL